ncbi:Tyramine beta-hydroxylase [Seminavis robusta]|uniref:Tyramine beta-hydroxylase n=1 Tax=Seminavis robusta TaxID=568900 RepID=A0A9N8HNZ9_9STRA|nr:Tyramine beta-hydroxylase [Seminavis robusta]|eukprot:Sro862_g212520.1 Tyramine beta-hydroxylase (878) ;mRNA; r:41069-43702
MVATAAAVGGANSPSVFERRFDLDGQGCSDIQWTVDMDNRELLLSWKSTAGAEWTAFGITNFGTMKGADMAVVKYMYDNTDSGGSFMVEDRYSKNASMPQLDVLQNVELLSAEYDQDDRMVVVIRRPLDSCDSHDIKVEPHKQYIICSSGQLEGEELSYHGPARSSGVVNFMVDEDLLFDQGFETPLANSTKMELSDGVLARGNVDTATSPFPVDIQMRGLKLDPQVVTHYVCATFDLPMDLRFASVEDVWDDGRTTNGSDTNSVFHHMHLHYCDDPELVEPEHQDGTPWDCFDKMPRCGIKASYAKGTGKNTVPSGLHFELPKGKYILQVHYENPFHKPIVNDRTGMRVWVQPPALMTRTSSAGLLQFDALHDSIHIPQDPEQKELTFQFQISADATREYVPDGGVLVFGSLFHMHLLGSRGRVELIRDGERIQTVYRSMSYDYDRQVPDWNRWRLMPGDAVVITCTFTPLKDQDVHGGFRTLDEMCGVHMGTAPGIPNLARAMGAFVKPNEPFLNSFMGPAVVNARMLNYSSYNFLPNPADRSYDTKTGFGENLCHTMVRAKMHPSTFEFSDAALCAQLVMLGAFFFTRLLSWRPVAKQLCIDSPDRRTRRNSIVYIGELLFSSVALPMACVTLVQMFPDNGYYNAVDPNTYRFMRGLVTMQCILYILELFYRIQVRVSLVMHHVLTVSATIAIYALENHTYSDVAYKFGSTLLLLAFTEQPLYIVLLLRNIGYRERNPKGFSRMCKLSTAVFIASRIVVIGLLIALVIQQSDESSSAWRVRNESFSEWWNRSDSAVSPAFVNGITLTLTCGILCANVFAAKALLHMAKTKKNIDSQSAEKEDVEVTKEVETRPTSSAVSSDESICRSVEVDYAV